MPLSLSQFTDQLTQSGLLASGDVQAALDALPAERRPADGEQLARHLVRQKKLTAYQAQQVYQGRGKHLVLGNYVVLDKLGQGGMGMVLKAEHRRMKRLVALKMLSPTVTKTPEALRRFQREVEAAAKLRHTNIVAADDADEAGGTHFLVMEYVEGADLAALVREQGPLPVDKALSCVLQAARGLEYAHNRGVVHRDIKPANLLLDREGTVKILDMGLARVETAGANQDDLTGTGQIMGTVDYMSPEQALDTKHADARADIYSLGITLWYLFTGRPVYEGNSTMAKLLAHRESAIPSLCAACPAASPALERVFTRMVAKTPGERYQTMSAAIADLEHCQSGQAAAPSVVAAPGEDSRLSEFLRGMNPTNAGGKSSGQTVAAASRTKVAAARSTQQELQPTVSLSSPAVDTDPTTELSLSKLPPAARTARRLPSASHWLARLPIPPRYRLPALIGGGLAAVLAAWAVIVLFWDTEQGTVRVEIHDPAISATVMGTTLSVQGTGDHSLTLEPGEHGLHVKYGDLEFDTDMFVLADGETLRLRIELLEGKVQVVREDGAGVIGERPLPPTIKPRPVAAGGWHGWPADAPPPAIAPFDGARAKAHQAAWAAHLGVPVEYENSIGMKFVLIPPGEFTMGSSSEEIEVALVAAEDEVRKDHIRSEGPPHKVVLTQPIYLGVCEVTQAHYEQVMGTNPSHFAATGVGKDAVVGLDTSTLPVERVSWTDAAEFCTKLSEKEQLKPSYFRSGETVTLLEGTGYRLPTEAQWEFACHAGTITKYWTGDQVESLDQVAWFNVNSGGRTHAVGELDANPLGLYDINGNLWEWVQDVWDPAYYGQFQAQAAIDPLGPMSESPQRVLRGGGWSYGGSSCRAAARGAGPTQSHVEFFGFRVALPVDAVRAVTRADGVTVQQLPAGGYEVLAPGYRARVGATGLMERVWTGETTLIESTTFGAMGRGTTFPVTTSQAGNTVTFEEGTEYRLTYEFLPQALIVRARVSTAAAERDGIDGKSFYLTHVTHFPPAARRVRPLDGTAEFDLPAAQESQTRHFVVDFTGGAQVEVSTGPAEHAAFVFPGGPLAWGRPQLQLDADNEIRFDIRPPSATAGAPPPAIAPFDAAQAKAHQAAWAGHLGVPVEYENSLGMKFALIPPGEFLMGSTPAEIEAALPAAGGDESWRARIRSEGPQHRVVLTQPIYVGVHEVTQGQYQQVIGENRSHFSATGEGKEPVAGLDTSTFPAETVNWSEAVAFCTRLSEQEQLPPFYAPGGETVPAPEGTGYRLPTEAQWEFACRAGTTTKYWTGDADEQLAAAAWTGGNAQDRTHAVGELQPNPFGLYDVHGNVWEWVQDAWLADYYAQFSDAPATDPAGASVGGGPRIIRGGEWYDAAANCRSASRYPNDPVTRNLSLGFRVALSVEAAQRATVARAEEPASP